jgi:hypothetical protein
MTLYEKVGRRYKPVAVTRPEYMDSFPDGAHLVIVTPGVRMTSFSIEPDIAAVKAVIEENKTEMCKVLMEASKTDPRKPLTKKQLKAWQAFEDSMGGSDTTLSVRSAYDIIGVLEKAIIEKARPIMKGGVRDDVLQM